MLKYSFFSLVNKTIKRAKTNLLSYVSNNLDDPYFPLKFIGEGRDKKRSLETFTLLCSFQF